MYVGPFGAATVGGIDPARTHLRPVLFVPGAGDDAYEYWRRLSAAWMTTETIVNVEHDMECSQALVDELLACPHPLCSHAYLMYLPRRYWAHGWASTDPRERAQGGGIRWVERGDERAGHSAIGFCKVEPRVRPGELERTEWPGVEMAVNRAVCGPWHLHWPGVEHYHKEPR